MKDSIIVLSLSFVLAEFITFAQFSPLFWIVQLGRFINIFAILYLFIYGVFFIRKKIDKHSKIANRNIKI